MPRKVNIDITIYRGPQSWFDQETRLHNPTPLLKLVYAQDEQTRIHRHVVVSDEAEPKAAKDPRDRRPAHVAAGSNDYASLQEHVISNFSGLVRSVRPQKLHLHNPPAQIQAQLVRDFSVQVQDYEYPMITPAVLRKVSEEWSEHLTGQDPVRERLLAALYPLTKRDRTKPVVLMFLGPSGVGKTETARFVNRLLSGNLMRKQFSMYHSEKFASYLFGGSHTEASFAHDLLDRESGVILLDEFDKANVAFHSAFYQLFDDGIFEDKNYAVSIGPSLIICTTNYKSEADAIASLGDALCSRFDALIEYGQLSPQSVREIISTMIRRRYDALDPEDKSSLDPHDIEQRLHAVAAREGNVRRLGKLVDEVVALQLVRSLFSHPQAVEPAQ